MSDIQEIKYWLDLLGGSVRGAVSQLVEQLRRWGASSYLSQWV